MYKKTIALVLTRDLNSQRCFEGQLRNELLLLEQSGFFSGANWTYTATDIWDLYTNLPEHLRRECIEMYPHVLRRIFNDRGYFEGLMKRYSPDIFLAFDGSFGEDLFGVLEKDIREKVFDLRTGVARYYMFFLLAMNSMNTSSSPRIVMDNITSFKDFFERVLGFPLFQDLKFLCIDGRIKIGRMVTFRNNVKILVNPEIIFSLVGESTLDNISLVVDETGNITEEDLAII